MGFYHDLSRVSLEQYKKKLITGYIVPSQKILREKIDERFNSLMVHGICNVLELQKALKSKTNISDIAEATGISTDYLATLRRAVNSYNPKDRKIKDFTFLKPITVQKLEQLGIKSIAKLFDKVASKTARKSFALQHDIPEHVADILAKIVDVSRLKYVNPAFAMLLIDSQYNTVEKIKKATYQDLYDNLIQTNQKKQHYKGNINLKDMIFLIEETENVVSDVEY